MNESKKSIFLIFKNGGSSILTSETILTNKLHNLITKVWSDFTIYSLRLTILVV